MHRRGFLKGLTASVGAIGFAPDFLQSLEDRLRRLAADLPTRTGPAYWTRVREEFSLNPGLAHLNCGSLGATPELVSDAIAGYVREIEGSPVAMTFGWGGAQMDVVREHAAAFIGAEPTEVALTRNTTEGMNAVATGIDWAPGDQILTTNHEHGGGMTCWQHVRRHFGVEIVYIEMPRVVESAQQIVDLVGSHITPRTKVCSFSHVDTITGVQLPMAEIAAVTRPRGILLVCDGAQAPGMLQVDVRALGVDTYAFSGHKWMLSAKGTGVLYVRDDVQDRVHPALLHDGYKSYTASGGTRGVDRVLGFGLTLDFHETIGSARIEARVRALSDQLRAQVDGIPGLERLTPADASLSSALVTYAVTRGNRADVYRRLRDEYQILVKQAQGTYAYCEEDWVTPGSYNALRFSTHIFNDELEIDRLVRALHTVMAEA